MPTICPAKIQLEMSWAEQATGKHFFLALISLWEYYPGECMTWFLRYQEPVIKRYRMHWKGAHKTKTSKTRPKKKKKSP